jgi:hypothetical protein
MISKFLNPLSVLLTAFVISLTAGCATVQTAFAPGVAEAKSAESGPSFNGALVPGSVDLGMSSKGSAESARLNAMAQYYAAKEAADLERGRSAEIARLNGMAEHFAAVSAGGTQSFSGGALIPGSVDLAEPKPSSTWNGALIPGSVDLAGSEESPSSTWNGALIPGSVDLAGSQVTSNMVYDGALVPGSVDLQIITR